MNSHFSPYQKEYDNYVFRSINHEMYHRKVLKSLLSPFDGKRSNESNIESKRWE